LVANGLNTNLGEERTSGITGKCLVFITPDADRTMNSYLGITETFSVNEIKDEELAQSEYLYMEGYLVTSETGRAAAIHARNVARENSVKTSITLSDPGIVEYFKDGLKEMIGDGVDLIFCNEAEALSFTGKEDLNAAMEALKNHGATLAVTRGPLGARIWDGEQTIDVDAPSVQAKDTNGAGDLFAGAFLYALTHGHSYFEAGTFACQCSSKLVTKFGARLDQSTIKQIYTKIFN